MANKTSSDPVGEQVEKNEYICVMKMKRNVNATYYAIGISIMGEKISKKVIDAIEIAVKKYCLTDSCGVFLNLNGVDSFTADAIMENARMIKSLEKGTQVTKVSIFVSSTIIKQGMQALFKIQKPSVPTKAFHGTRGMHEAIDFALTETLSEK